MKFMTAQEAREKMGQIDKTAVKLARKAFKNSKKEILNEIKIGTAEKKTEIKVNMYYPFFFFEEPKYSRKNYEEEFKNLMIGFLTSQGYSVRFRCDWSSAYPRYWGILYISWKNEE